MPGDGDLIPVSGGYSLLIVNGWCEMGLKALPANGGKPDFRKRCAGSYRKFKKSRQLLLILIPGLAFYLLFMYAPMYGVVAAFQKYSPFLGYFKSKWVGLDNFTRLFTSPDFWPLLRNTLFLGFFSFFWGFPVTILFAIILNECRTAAIKRTVQTISYLPSFLSVVIVCSMAIDFLSPANGMINRVIALFGFEKIYFMVKPEWFRSIYVVTGIWSGLGTGAIVYLAALSGVDPQLYEAATVDGCGRIKAIFYISLPSILPTITTMLILQCGSLINVGFEKILLLYNPATYTTSDVISTFVYRIGIVKADYSFGTAVGLFQSVINVILLLLTNALSRRISETSLW